MVGRIAAALVLVASAAHAQNRQAVIDTTAGTIVMDLLADKAPNHVALFVKTAGSGGYDGTTFFRMIKFGIIQGGDPVTKDAAARARFGTGGLNLLNSQRPPFYARLDLRASFRPRGEKGRWQFYVEAINATVRKNVSAIDATLEYDPDSDRPKLVETPTDGVPFLPTFGVRFRF